MSGERTGEASCRWSRWRPWLADSGWTAVPALTEAHWKKAWSVCTAALLSEAEY
jgi:hypothetical protein